MAEHNELGHRGEEEARRFLLKNGYRIVAQNWRYRGYEIDIVAETDDWIVFVEVKTRSSDEFGNPEDFINNRRIKRLTRGGHHFVMKNNISKDWRFDVIAILWDEHGNFSLKHFDDAFLPNM